MKKLWMVIILVAAISLAGCGSSVLGSHDAKSEINAALDRYAAAYKAKNTDAVADVYTYPCKNIDENGRESVIRSRNEMKSTMGLGFALIDSIYDVQITNRTVAVSSNTASVTATVFVDAKAFGYRVRTTSQAEFALVNSGGWKISTIHTKSSTTSPVN